MRGDFVFSVSNVELSFLDIFNLALCVNFPLSVAGTGRLIKFPSLCEFLRKLESLKLLME